MTMHPQIQKAIDSALRAFRSLSARERGLLIGGVVIALCIAVSLISSPIIDAFAIQSATLTETKRDIEASGLIAPIGAASAASAAWDAAAPTLNLAILYDLYLGEAPRALPLYQRALERLP